MRRKRAKGGVGGGLLASTFDKIAGSRKTPRKMVCMLMVVVPLSVISFLCKYVGVLL